MRKHVLILCIIALGTGVAAAQSPLRDVKSIDDAVFDVAVANEIRKNCPDITARMFRAVMLFRDVKAQARALGYTDAEIEAYAESDAEKARLRAKGADFFAANGVVAGDPQSYCALGRQEIEKSSRIGSLLKVK